MQLFIYKQVGRNKYTFVVEGDNLFSTIMESRKLSFYDVPTCGKCNSDNLILTAHIAGKKDEFEYTEIRCLKCGASLTFGQTKADKDVFFLRKNDDKTFAWKEKQSSESSEKNTEFEKPDSNSLPF